MAVIWLIAILSMACMATLRVISFDMDVSSAKIHGSRARQVAEMGIAIGSHNLVKRSDPLLHRMDESTGEGFDVTITSEAGRFNINWILASDDKDLLRDIFIKWGLELDTAQEIADAFKDWYDPDDNEELKGAEKDYYEKQGRINQPFNRAFYDVNEMALVRGMELVEAVRPDWREWFTVLSGGGLSVNEASAELLAAAADISVEQADAVPEKVRGPDGIRDTTDDVMLELSDALGLLGVNSDDPVISRRFSADDQTQRIESIGMAEGTKRKITVVVTGRTGRPILLERKEEIIP
ncbi:general secretion pathway protein GspK [Luteolibacter yonseiensis]|uniref:General secretion pathway protein GspK n=2 Tax=Luteolibacter yonseiensis TaxID=1144680 RepID=A0A934R4K2_9BACT|nr:type II secretion system protein GspK [Luteolibacter yonseiensis]MBK1816151.1 general secretion pathway protein GspK [Luteolibacter yonseiensis]